MVMPWPSRSRMSTRKTESPSVRFFDLVARRGAREQQHQIGVLGARGPDLLAVDHVVSSPSRRAVVRSDGGVGAARRLGDAEGLQAQFAGGDLRQIAFLLRVAAVPQDRAHDVHLRVAGGAVAAGRRGSPPGSPRPLPRAEPAAAVFLRDQRREIAGLGQRCDELGRIGALAVELAPVFAGKLGAQRAHAGPNIGKFVRLGARPFFTGLLDAVGSG